MNEDNIKAGLNFLATAGSKYPLEDQKKFLSTKMSEEEISEVYKRHHKQQTQGERRLKQVDTHFQPQAQGGASSLMTTASVAILAATGITYLLDSYKDKQDKNLRDELKDRVKSSIDEQRETLSRIDDSQR